MPRKTRRIRSPVPHRVVALREKPCVLAAGRPDHAAGEVVRVHVNTAVQTRLAGLVRGVVVGGPLQDDVGARPRLDPERSLLDGPLGETAWEVLAAGDPGKDLGRRAAERAVA